MKCPMARGCETAFGLCCKTDWQCIGDIRKTVHVLNFGNLDVLDLDALGDDCEGFDPSLEPIVQRARSLREEDHY